MLTTWFQGLLFGIAYIAPIGLQNLFMINTALAQPRKRALRVALIVTFFDISLAVACFYGIGKLLELYPWLELIVLAIGSIIVMYIGITLLLSHGQSADQSKKDNRFSYKSAVLSAFSVAWLNPQALLDGTMLLGAFRISLATNVQNYFILGVAVASFIWFISLTTIVSVLKDRFQPRFLVLLNRICGVIIIIYGIKLLITFIQKV
ncbi:amino acid transporter [Paucilactobacillus hokkaidonensis JCM 18461]|uniref:Amino acid transporter n=2 Tax=Paucilactobacillus hokkaidonensis TaxID=1193095 RepID=A0A0A1GY41_9LACO|nr:LysE family transporter [Paucilactobacillus hokkaidonensis]KRO10358.1 amino acid efflux protein [Paucilactobacillus hokkaidonensis]BAP85814.1 amino acid transporter [Paucilactobacillus hokkaidonensis JCM 18461]